MTARILVPLDGSALAERAVPSAMMLARGLRADVVLLRAIALPADVRDWLDHTDLTPDAHLAQLGVEADEYLCRIVGRFDEAGLQAHAVVQNQPPAEAIVDYAEQTDILQIVMATHGHSGLNRWRHGSVAERVLQSSKVPVLIVYAHEKTPSDPQQAIRCQRILVPLDGSYVAEQVLPPAISIAQALDAEMVLLRVPIAHVSGSLTGEWFAPLEGSFATANQIVEEYLEGVATRLRPQGINVRTAVRTGGVANVIVDYAQANRIDLIAMCTHGRTGLARWTLGSVADRVLRACSVPLLLVRAR